MRNKSRSVEVINNRGFARLGNGGTYNTEWHITLNESQETSSTSNPYWLLGKVPYDIGGPFSTLSSYYRDTPKNNRVAVPWHDLSNLSAELSGIVWPTDPREVHAPPLPPVFPGDLDADGAHAIALTAPTNPNGQLLVALAELKRDGIPRVVGSGLWKTRAREFREYGNEYLNYQFGWVPFVSDIRKFCRSVKDHEKIVSSFYKNSDTPVKVSYRFPVVEEEIVAHDGRQTVWPNIGVGGEQPFFSNGDPYGNLTRTISKRTEKWFEGEFTYHIPLGDSQIEVMQRSVRQADKLFGTRLTPEVLWEAAPWSWAIDWFGNFDDIFHNVSLFLQDSLVLRYGYLMCHETYKTTYRLSDLSLIDSGGILTFSAINERKRRVSASPYGFGLTWDGFTPYQLSILAALGISNRRRVGM